VIVPEPRGHAHDPLCHPDRDALVSPPAVLFEIKLPLAVLLTDSISWRTDLSNGSPGLYVKIYDHLLRPLTAPDRSSAPPELASALDALRRLVADQAAHARLPVAT
jgi:hypothetical protein